MLADSFPLVQFDNRSYGTDISSHWDFGDSQFTSTTNPIHEFMNTGTINEYYTVQLVVRSDQYFCTDTMERIIEVFPAPLADFVFTPESPLLYPATTIYLTDETSDGNWDYLWNFGDGITSNASGLYNYEYVYDTSGIYWIQLPVYIAMYSIPIPLSNIPHTFMEQISESFRF